MKIKLLVSLCLIFQFSLFCTGQQWLDKTYDFEISENTIYGNSVNYYGGLDTLKMDIYSPVCDDSTFTSRRPLLIWIHGGAFIAGNKNEPSIVKMCEEFAKRGYITASISYRLGFISDDDPWTCNYPGYSCIFATDSAEWARAYYRGVQDAKGAIRYLVNNNESYRIDTNNVFIAGESAGAFLALGAALMDTDSERPIQTFATSDVPIPGDYASSCAHNQNVNFVGSVISRPDLGSIQGTIEPTSINFTLKGVANMYGGMYSNLLENHTNSTKPAIYSFHQPCDLIVPIDSGVVFQGLTWCFTNGYNCNGIANNNIKLYGSRAINNWNTANEYGYNMLSEFTNLEFPYSFWIGEASCADQALNGDCHTYDNPNLRENNLAQFFAPLITTSPICSPDFSTFVDPPINADFQVFPNPVIEQVTVTSQYSGSLKYTLVNIVGQSLIVDKVQFSDNIKINLVTLNPGVYFLNLQSDLGTKKVYRILKK